MTRFSLSRLFPRLKSDAFLLQAPLLSAISSAVLIVCCIYSFCVLALSAGYTGHPGPGVEAVNWVATLAVFYGVFLETRPLLAQKFKLTAPSTPAELDYMDLDERHGMGLLCVGLLCEALTGVPGLHDGWPRTYTIFALFFLLAVGSAGVSHLRRHWLIRRTAKATFSAPPLIP